MIAGVVFDLDGTLVDSWAVHLRCLRAAATAVGVREPSAARLAAAQRPTDLQTLHALVGADRAGPAHREYQRELSYALARDPARAMPGAAALLADLGARGVSVAGCTGRSRADARALLDASGLAVQLLVAREDAARPKPAPDGLLRALRLLGRGPEESLYVGDSEADALQGRSTGVRTLLVGPRPTASPTRGPDEVERLSRLADLTTLLQREYR